MWQLPNISALGMATRDEKSLHLAEQANLLFNHAYQKAA